MKYVTIPMLNSFAKNGTLFIALSYPTAPAFFTSPPAISFSCLQPEIDPTVSFFTFNKHCCTYMLDYHEINLKISSKKGGYFPLFVINVYAILLAFATSGLFHLFVCFITPA